MVCDFTFSYNFLLAKNPKTPFAIRVYRTFVMVFNWGWLIATKKAPSTDGALGLFEGWGVGIDICKGVGTGVGH